MTQGAEIDARDQSELGAGLGGRRGAGSWAGAQVEPSGSRMAVAADRLLASLSPAQAAKAVYPYDSPERLDWHFIPRSRKGCRSRSSAPNSVRWPSA